MESFSKTYKWKDQYTIKQVDIKTRRKYNQSKRYIHVQTVGQTNEWTNRRANGLTDERTEGLTATWTNRRTGQTDIQINRQMNRLINKPENGWPVRWTKENLDGRRHYSMHTINRWTDIAKGK